MLDRGLLTPTERVEAAIAAYENGEPPLNSVEGFVRQIIGWREFSTGVYWHRGPEYKRVNALGAQRPPPAWFCTAETPMNCLHHVLRQNLELGWNHHIQRLMVLGNFMLIAGINPQERLRWFNEMYVDAFDWAMAANVLGMSLYAGRRLHGDEALRRRERLHSQDEQLLRRLPLRFGPKNRLDACPSNYLYWDFIGRYAERFGSNPRMRRPAAFLATRRACVAGSRGGPHSLKFMNVPRIAASRVRALNPCDTVPGDYVLYWMQQSQRAVGNHALEYAVDLANELGRPGSAPSPPIYYIAYKVVIYWKLRE